MTREEILTTLSHTSIELARMDSDLKPLISDMEKALESRYADYHIDDILAELVNIRDSIFNISCSIDEYSRRKMEE